MSEPSTPPKLLRLEAGVRPGAPLPASVVVGALAVVVVAAAVGVLAEPLDPARGEALHLLLEWSAFAVAALTATLAFVDLRVQDDVTVPILAAALGAAGIGDAFHALVAMGILPVRDLEGFLGWSWALSRTYAAGVLVIGALVAPAFGGRPAARRLVVGTLLTALLALGGTSSFLVRDLPPVHASGWLARPSSLLPLSVLAVAAPAILRLHRRARGLFSHALLVSLAPLVAAEVLMASSRAHFDGAFHAAHVLKIVSYLVPFVGLALARVRGAQRELDALSELEGARRELLEKTWTLEASLTDKEAALREAQRAKDDAVALAWRLGRSNRELERFATVAAHDLQEPLRKLQAFSDRLDQRYGEEFPEGARSYLDRMHDSAKRMHRLVEGLLAFARVTTRGRAFEEVDLEELVGEVVEDLELLLQESGGWIEVGALPVLLADGPQIRQVIQNLLSNALKFRKPDVPPLVRISASLLDEAHSPIGTRAWQVSIADNGIGFEEKYLDRIFEIFQRLHGRHEFEGTGLGLAICRKVAERHGGLLGASSRPGEGATFRLVLPLEPPPPSAAAAEDHLPQESP